MNNRIINKYKSMPRQIRASFWFLVCGFAQKAISAISAPIFTRLMSTAEYGQFSVFTSLMSICNCVVTLNLYGGFYTQGIVKYDFDRKRFTSSLQGLSFTLVALWLNIYLVFNNTINSLLSMSTLQMILMFVLMWATACFNFWAVEQRVDLNYKKLVLITLMTSLLTPLLGIIMVLMSSDKVTARIISMVIVAGAVYPLLSLKQFKNGKQFFSKDYWKYALTFAVPLIPHYLSQMILNSSDRIMISKMVGHSEAGIYSLSYSIAQIMMLFNTSLLQTIEPWIYQKISANQSEKIHKVAYPAFIGIAIVNLLLIVLAPEVIKIFAPPSYYEAIWVIPPIAMSVYFLFTYSFFALFEFYFEETKYITFATVTGAVLNIILNFLFIRKFGYYAAGYTTLMCYIVYSIMHYIFMTIICKQKIGNVKVYDIKVLISVSVSFMIIGFVFMSTYSHPYIRYTIVLLIAVVAMIKRKTLFFVLKQLVSIRKGSQ